jgi:hypothetical protein
MGIANAGNIPRDGCAVPAGWWTRLRALRLRRRVQLLAAPAVAGRARSRALGGGGALRGVTAAELRRLSRSNSQREYAAQKIDRS